MKKGILFIILIMAIMLGGFSYSEYIIDNKIVDSKNINAEEFMELVRDNNYSLQKVTNNENLDKEFVDESIHFLLESYIKELNYSTEDFSELEFYIANGSIYNGKQKVNGYYTYFDDRDIIIISSEIGQYKFWKTLQHELAHFISINHISDEKFDKYKKERGILNQDRYNLDGDWGKRVEENFAEDISSLFVLPNSIHKQVWYYRIFSNHTELDYDYKIGTFLKDLIRK